MKVRVGLPKFNGSFLKASAAAGAPILVSANGLYNHSTRSFKSFGWSDTGSHADVALDSAGFTAMDLYKGYPWSMTEYVDMVATNFPDDLRVKGRGVGWTWWAAMDFCCEPEVARDNSEVINRVRRTVSMYKATAEYVRYLIETEGMTWLTYPMPTLQGWHPSHYQLCADLYGPVFEEFFRPDLAAEAREYEAWLAETRALIESTESAEQRDMIRREVREIEERRRQGIARAAAQPAFPELMGIGSVCRRPIHGDTGMLAIMDAALQATPETTRFHFFGVKGSALPHIARHPQGGRIDGIDSLAWDFMARRKGREYGQKFSVQWRGSTMYIWYQRQLHRFYEALRGQVPLFPGGSNRGSKMPYPWADLTPRKPGRTTADEEDE